MKSKMVVMMIGLVGAMATQGFAQDGSAGPGGAPSNENVPPTRTELFDKMTGEQGDAPAKPGKPQVPRETPITKEVNQEIEVKGTVNGAIRLDVEFNYLSTNRFKKVIIGGKGWVEVPEEKQLRPGVQYGPDGTYSFKFNTFNKSWLGARYALHIARIGILRPGAKPAVIEFRADKPGTPALKDLTGISVRSVATDQGYALQATMQTANGTAQDILSLPETDGTTTLTVPVNLDN